MTFQKVRINSRQWQFLLALITDPHYEYDYLYSQSCKKWFPWNIVRGRTNIEEGESLKYFNHRITEFKERIDLKIGIAWQSII